jgi:hypothetical protein
MTIKFIKYGKNVGVPTTIVIPNLEKFRTDFIHFSHHSSPEKSGKATSYANYIEYLLQNYYDNFGEILNPLDKKSTDKLSAFRTISDTLFRDYNNIEGRFPNAAIEEFIRFHNHH